MVVARVHKIDERTAAASQLITIEASVVSRRAYHLYIEDLWLRIPVPSPLW